MSIVFWLVLKRTSLNSSNREGLFSSFSTFSLYRGENDSEFQHLRLLFRSGWVGAYNSREGTVGNSQLARMFVFRSLLVQDFFLLVKLSPRLFFSDKYCFFWTVKSGFTVYVFVLKKLFYTHNRSKDTGHLLMQNLFDNVRTVREEEASWSGRLPCAFFQSMPSAIPLPKPIIMMPFIHQDSPSVVPYLFRKSKILRWLLIFVILSNNLNELRLQLTKKRK